MSEVQGRVLNWKKGPEDSRDYKSVRRLSAPVELPSEFELEKQIPIYDQYDIGSCVANSAASCYRFESAQVIGNFSFNPSRLFVYYNARKLQGWEREDSGAYIRDGFKAMNKWGLANENVWPYVTRDFAKEPTSQVYSDGLNNVIVKYARVEQTETALKETLLTGAAVSFGFNVYNSFMSGTWDTTTGMMPLPKSTERVIGGHAVTIIGYNDAKKAFLIQNSWGTSWGLKGKFWMPYSFLLDGSECDDFWAIETIKIAGVDPVNPNPPTPPSEIDWLSAAKILFKADKELWALRKSSLLRLGIALGVNVDEKRNFRFNYELVKAKLGL